MKLEQLLKMTAGAYELTIFSMFPEINGFPRFCEDEEIPDHYVGEGFREIDYSNYVNMWNWIRDAEVTQIRITKNRNYDGPAMWVTVKA